MMTTIARALKGRLHSTEDGERGFALIYSALVMLIISVLSVAVLSLVVQEAKPTRFDRKREQTLNTAEAGLESALNRLRTSVKPDGSTGSLSALPQCTSPNNYSVLTGTPDNGKTTYSANVYYLRSANNPAGLTLSQIQSLAIPCSPLREQPAYAYIQSAGLGTTLPGASAGSGNRSLHATYSFLTVNTTTVGGRIKEYNQPNNPDQNNCYDVGSPAPAVGTIVTLAPCQAIGTPQQSWIYEPNLTIQWTGNTTLATPLCIQASASMVPQLQACAGAPTGQADYPYNASNPTAEQQQEWSFNDNGHLEGAASGGDTSGQCLQPQSETAVGAVALVLSGCSDGTYSNNSVNPDPAFGAGGATGTTNGLPHTIGLAGNTTCGMPGGSCTGQLTNYQETGRCLDITGQDTGNPAEIDYPCKQKPNPNLQTWNQIYTFTPVSASSSLGTLSTSKPNGADGNNSGAPQNWCMTAAKPWIIFTLCNGTGSSASLGSSDNVATQLWTFTGNISGDYDDSYNIKSTALVPSGQCMTIVGNSLDPNQPSGPYISNYLSSEALASCDGSDVQKWNAPPGQRPTTLGNITEEGQPSS